MIAKGPCFFKFDSRQQYAYLHEAVQVHASGKHKGVVYGTPNE